MNRAQVLIILADTAVEEVPDVEELILGRNQLKVIDEGYQDLKLETPDWVINKMGDIESEINSRTRSELQRQLKLAKVRRSALGSAEEKRKILEDTIKDLETKLG